MRHCATLCDTARPSVILLNGAKSGTIECVVNVAKIVQKAADNPSNVRFDDWMKVCHYHFGDHRQSGSHCVFKTPWPGMPRVNIQNRHGMVAPYQVKQVLSAIDKLKSETNQEK